MPRAVLLSSGDESGDGAPGEHQLFEDQSSGSSSNGSDSGDDDDDDDSHNGRRSGFFDVEAEESDGDASHDSSHAESDLDTTPGRPSSRRTFAQFMQLPPELRSRVWEHFCPDLVTKARFLQFVLAPASAAAVLRSSLSDMWTARDKVYLADQTQSLRCLMAAHRESREMGLRVFPHTLAIDSGDGDCDGIVCFNKHLDVIFVDGIEHLHAGRLCHLPGFAENIVNAATVGWISPFDDWGGARVRAALRLFPNIQRLYIWQSDYDLKKRDLHWAVSDCVHQYLMETFEKGIGLGEDTETIACWPDVDRHPDFAKFQIPPIHVRGRPKEVDRLVQKRGVHLWPIVTFEFGAGMTRYKKLLQVKDVPYPDGFLDSSDESSSTSFSDMDHDEYESEGIDDDELIQDSSSEDDLISDQLSEGPLSAREPSGGKFSSPELDTEDEIASGPPEPELPRRPPKRRIVTDSDDDSSAPDEPRAKRARISRPAVADSDDETDQALEQPRRDAGPRRRTTNISESDSDGHSGGAEAHPEDGAGSSSDGDSDSDPPQQRMSLAERLQAHRDAHPLPPSDEEGCSTEDDEEDEDDDSADEDGGCLVDRMASESDGEGDEFEREW
ncbi:zinc finger domain-containing protein [Hirsutella rhossiliensis]|uniref:Zinc finger domain-containing protein n=1 Tax=Hirsutella rhossiliensis TaxID=111463 RepID=A0A9P8SLE1_9HYPO|nr:zinc finger domain-containing protein [Hirsutella rhossiliensis]KAH0967383.1 zinc finger domain-containing protein [Hirsutella rhossiliensis]